MKRIISIVVGLFVLLMFTGISFCSGPLEKSVAAQSSKKSSVADQSAKKPSVADQSAKKPSVVDQSSKKPSLADQSSKKPSVADQSSKKPLATTQSSKKSSAWVQSSSKFSSIGPYVSGRIGTTFLTNTDFSEKSEIGTLEFKQGYALNVAGGYKFRTFRLEGELGYQKNKVDKCVSQSCGKRSGDMESYSLLVNGYYDFINKTKFTPFITAGIGVARVNSYFDDIENLHDTGLTYQLGAGISYAINRMLSVDLKYRYFATKGHELAETEDGVAAQNVSLGLKYNF